MKFTTKSTTRRATTPGTAATARERGGGPGRAPLGRAPLLVEDGDECEGERAQGGGDEERAADADRVGQDAAGERADRGREDLRGLHEADGPAGVLARRLRRGHREAERPDAAEEADADAQREQLADARDRGREREDHHVRDERLIATLLWPWRSASRPHTGARRPARSGATPMRTPAHSAARSAPATPRSRTKRGRNGSTNAKPVKTANTIATVTTRLRRAGGRRGHERSSASATASSPSR